MSHEISSLQLVVMAAPPPPGFEHVVTGKRSVSSRARKLMGDQVKIGPHTDYPTPMPMEMPERELREQQHFIGEPHADGISNRESKIQSHMHTQPSMIPI